MFHGDKYTDQSVNFRRNSVSIHKNRNDSRFQKKLKNKKIFQNLTN